MSNRPNNRVRREANRAIRLRKIRRENARLLAALAVFVVLAVAGITMQSGRAMVHEERVLDCPVTGVVAHTHNADCYGAEGNLVCQLPEVELHVHDESCYIEEQVLVCGLEESEGAHRHDEGCYDEEGSLVCGLEESDGRVHDDSCYEVTRELTCEKEEIAEEHVHGQGCFRTVVVDDGEEMDAGLQDEAVDADPQDEVEGAGEAADAVDGEVARPAQSFRHEFVDDKRQLQLRVSVEAPEGALPEGATMRAEWVDTGAEANAGVQAAIEDAVAKQTEGRIDAVQAVDITFLDATGAEVEPALPVTVTMTSPQIADAAASPAASPLVVHVESEREAVERGQELGLAEVQIEGQVVDPLTDRQLARRDIEAGEDELVFDAERFSVYAVVYTVDFHYSVDGKTYDLTLQGGDAVSLRELLAGLKVFEAKDADLFMGEVAGVEFSDTSLVAVAQIGEDITAGELRERFGLVAQHSAEVTDEMIAAMNAKQFQPGDWALLSLRPFDTQETLTVTMKNGETFTIQVTDAQITETVIDAKGDTWVITVTYGPEAGIPYGAELHVQEITEAAERQEYVSKTQEALGRVTDDSSARFFDISIIDMDGNEIQPAAEVSVEIRLLDTKVVEDTQVVHFGETAELMDLEREPDSLSFQTDGFSVFAVVTVETEKGSYVFHGEGYTVTITHTAEAQIPLGTILTVRELDPESDEYIQRLGQAWYEVNREYFEVEEMRANYNEGMGDLPELHLVNLDTARFFDISFEYNGEKIEPKDAVTVEISYDKGLKALGDSEPVSGVAHFVDDGVELIEGVETETDKSGGIVSFKYEQSSFSDTGTFVGQETYDAKAPQRMAAAPVYDPANAVTLSALGAGAKGENNTLTATGSSNSTLPAPASSKTLTPNTTSDGQNDGTYTLNLSVSGSSKSTSTAEVTRSNVLIVMDRSSSMINHNVTTYTEYNGSHQNGTTYYGKVGDSYVTLYYNNGRYYRTRSGYWPNYQYYNEYTGQRYTREVTTRLDAEQAALSELITQLLAKNTAYKQDSQGYLLDDNDQRVLDENNQPIKVNDIIEMSVISFADRALGNYPRNDGVGNAPNYGTEVDWSTSYDTLMAGVNVDTAPSGTNWEDALRYAKYIADTKHAAQPDEPVFILFLTDGEPTAYAGETGGAKHYNNTGGGFEVAYEPAKDDARALVTSGYEFYGIFTYGEGEAQIGYLKRLVNVAYGHADNTTQTDDLTEHFHDAGDNEALLAAFQHILSKISGTIAVGNVTMVDGLTTDATASTLVSGRADGFHYKVTGPLGDLYSVTATGGDSDPTVTFTINGHSVPGVKKTEHVTRNQVDANGNPIPDPDNPGKYLTVTEDKTYYSATVGTTEYKMALAHIASDGQITWDLSAVGTLMEGYSYNCSFVVWPDQEAYDYVAGLNNGLPGFVWNQNAATAVRNDNDDIIYWTGGVTTGGPDGNGYRSIVKYPNGTYAVLTNTNQSVTYSYVDTKTDETTGETVTTYDGPYTKPLEHPDPMPLMGTSSQLEKVWNINRDPSILYRYLYESKDENDNPVAFDIGFVIERDGEEYRQVHLPGTGSVTGSVVSYDWSAYGADDLVQYNGVTFSKRWSQDFSIATGLMLSEAQMDARDFDKSRYPSYTYNGTTYYVLEEGHDFKISEPTVGYEFDFEAPTYHPMLVDGVLTDVKFSTEGSTKSISGMEALEVDAGTGKSALSVLNTLRGYINLKKQVIDQDNKPLDTGDKEFTFEVSLTNPLPVFEGESIPWFGVNGLYYHDVAADDNYYQAEYVNGHLMVTTEDGGPYPAVGTAFNPDSAEEQTITYTVDGEQKTVTICGNQMTPTDGTATDGYKKVSAEVKITQSETLYIANVPVNTQYSIQEIVEAGYQLVNIERSVGSDAASGAGSVETGIVEGEIAQNTETLLTYTNKCVVTDITLQKTDDGGEGLAGAVFQLKRVGTDGLSESDASAIASVSGLSEITKTVDGNTRTYASAFETDGLAQTIGGLPDGTYRLYEVIVPAGYISTYRYIQFDIADRSMVNATTDTGDTSKLDTSANDIDLMIANEPGVALPAAGGPGSGVIYLLGVALAGLGAAGLVMQRRMVA